MMGLIFRRLNQKMCLEATSQLREACGTRAAGASTGCSPGPAEPGRPWGQCPPGLCHIQRLAVHPKNCRTLQIMCSQEPLWHAEGFTSLTRRREELHNSKICFGRGRGHCGTICVYSAILESKDFSALHTWRSNKGALRSFWLVRKQTNKKNEDFCFY